jgi:hypothetical protein
VVTSPRKLDVVSWWQLMGLMLKIAVRGAHYDSQWVRDILYGERAQKCRAGSEASKPKT